MKHGSKGFDKWEKNYFQIERLYISKKKKKGTRKESMPLLLNPNDGIMIFFSMRLHLFVNEKSLPSEIELFT